MIPGTIRTVTLSLALILMTVAGEKKGAEPGRLRRMNRRVGLAGAVLILTSLFAAGVLLLAVRGEEELFRRVLHSLTVFGLLSFTALALLFLLLFLASLRARRNAKSAAGEPTRAERFARRVRAFTSLCASLLLLLTTLFYAILAAENRAAVSPVVYVCGVGEALLLRLTLLFEP